MGYLDWSPSFDGSHSHPFNFFGYFTLLLTCGPDLRTKPCGANFLRPNPIANLRQKTCRNAAGRAFGHYGASSALLEPHTARPNQSSVGMASTNPRGGSMGLQGPPYAVLSPLVTDPLAPPGDPESSLFLTCHFVRKGPTRTKSPKWAKPARLIHD